MEVLLAILLILVVVLMIVAFGSLIVLIVWGMYKLIQSGRRE